MTTSQTSSFNNPSGRSIDASGTQVRARSNGWSDSVGGQWNGVAAGAITGVAASVLMMTLGAALGLTATAAVADSTSGYAVNSEGIGQAAVGFSIGAGIWLLISAAVVGIVGGLVLAKMSHTGRAYSPGAHGFLTWSLGVVIAVVFAASGAGAISTAVGAGAAGAAGSAAGTMATERGASIDAVRSAESTGNGVAAEAGLNRDAPVLTVAEREEMVRAGEVAATAAATAAWFALIALLVGLVATIGAASQRKFQTDPSRVLPG
jgi:hypothetical protein